MSSSCRNLCLALGAAALFGLTARSAHGANWEFLPRIELGGNYTENYRMADTRACPPCDFINVYGPYLNAQLNAELVSPNWNIDIIPRVYSTYFPSDHADQSTNEYLDVDGAYATERSNLTWLAHYSNETVINSELLPATFPGVALGEIVGGVSGRVSVRNRRQLERLAPAYTYDLTQRTHLHLSGDVERTTFSQSLFQQVGYNSYTGRAGVSFDVSPRSEFILTGLGERFVPQAGGHDTNRYGADLEWNMTETQVMHFYARVGASRMQAQSNVGTIASTGFSGGVGVDLRYQVTEFTFDALRAVRPSEVGAEVTYDELRFRALHAFEPLLSGIFGLRALRLRGASSSRALSVTGEDYYTAEAGLEYQLTERIRLEGRYDFYWQQFQGSPSAHSSAIDLSFVYQPLSRYQPLPEFTGIPQEQ